MKKLAGYLILAAVAAGVVGLLAWMTGLRDALLLLGGWVILAIVITQAIFWIAE